MARRSTRTLLRRWLAFGTALTASSLAMGGCLADLEFQRSEGAFCDRQDACAGNNYCDFESQRCKPTLSGGSPCDAPNQCETGFCVDSVCCNGPCNVACLTCAAPDSPGLCQVQSAGNDPRGDCPGTAACGEEGFCEGAAKWAVRIGGDGSERAVDIALDPEGNLIVVGTFDQTIHFGGESVDPVGGDDVFIVKLDGNDGSVLFHTTFGSAGDDRIAGVELNRDCDVIIAGDFSGQLDLWGTPLSAAGPRAGFVARLGRRADSCDPIASASWAKLITGSGRAEVADVSVAPSGNIALTGDHDGAIAFDGNNALTAATVTAWASSFTPAGELLWRRSFGDDAAEQRGVAVASDSGGNVLVAIDGGGSLDFGGSAGIEMGSVMDVDMFVAKLDAGNGLGIWSFPYDGDADQHASAIAVDSADAVWFTGSFRDEVMVPGRGEIDASDGIDGFFVKLGGDGGYEGSGALRGPFDDEPRAIALDDRGRAVIVGGFDLSLELEGIGTLDANGARDVFVLSLAPDASLEWGVPFGGTLLDQASAVVVEPTQIAGSDEMRGDLLATGHFEGVVRLGSEALAAAGGTDVFVARFAR